MQRLAFCRINNISDEHGIINCLAMLCALKITFAEFANFRINNITVSLSAKGEYGQKKCKRDIHVHCHVMSIAFMIYHSCYLYYCPFLFEAEQRPPPAASITSWKKSKHSAHSSIFYWIRGTAARLPRSSFINEPPRREVRKTRPLWRFRRSLLGILRERANFINVNFN